MDPIVIYPNAPAGTNMGTSALNDGQRNVNSTGLGMVGVNNRAPTTADLLQALMGAGPSNAGALTQSRYNSALSLTPPPMQIGAGERLMRMAGAGLAKDGQPPNHMLAAALTENAVVDALNRQNAMDAYNAQVKALSPFIKAANKNKSKTGLNVAAVPDTAAVMLNIDRAIPMIQEDIDSFLNTFGFGGMKTGLLGQMFKSVGGTDANDLNAKLDTIKGNIGFDKLQRMRDASPTGGALGQVSQMELQQLNASLGNLNIDQTPEELKRNLMDIRRYYVSSVKALYAEYEQAFMDGKIDANEWAVIKQKLAPALGGNMISNSSSSTPQLSDEELLAKYGG